MSATAAAEIESGGRTGEMKGQKEKILRKHVKSPWLGYLSTEDKKYELRLTRDEWANIREGQLIEFFGNVDDMPAKILMKVTEIRTFDDFASALAALGVNNVLPGISGGNSQVIGEQIYNRIYPRKDVLKHKVVALKVERVWNR